MEKSISFNTKYYFEGVIYIFGGLLCVISLIVLLYAWYIAIILAFVGFIILTTTYQLKVDLEAKKVEDYLSFLGRKVNVERFSYSELEYIFINESKFSQQLNLKSISTNVRGTLYTAYLKSDIGKYYMGESEDLARLRKAIGPLAQKMSLEIRESAEV